MHMFVALTSNGCGQRDVSDALKGAETLAALIERQVKRPTLHHRPSSSVLAAVAREWRERLSNTMQWVGYLLGWKQFKLLYVSKESKQSPHLFRRGARRNICHLNDVRAGIHLCEC